MSRYFLYASFALIQLLNAVSATAVSVAFPQIAADYHASVSLAAWVLGANQLGLLALGLVAGGMCDIVGKKRVATFALSLFAVGSLLSALAPNIYLLIASRLVVGMATGSLSVTFIAMVAELFPKSRQKAIGLIASAYFVGMIVGPNIGGWVTESLGWRWVFWLSIPVGVLGVIICSTMVQGDRKVAAAPVNLKGAGVFAASMSFIMIGLSSFGNLGKGMPGWVAGVLVGIGLLLFLVFVRLERRSERPLVDPQMVRGRQFMASNLFNVAYGAVWSMSNLVPLYAVSIYGLTTLQSGLAVTPWTVALLLSTTVASFLVRRTGYRVPMVAGSFAMIAGFFLLGLELKSVTAGGFHLGGSVLMLGVMGMMGLGAGFALPAANNVCTDMMPDRIATVMGVKYTFRHIGGIFSLAVASATLSIFGMDSGFKLVMLGVAGLMALALPAIWVMPKSHSDRGSPAKG